tara:strand:+ start:1985 stop:2326 length:342 start_codon:yes stop_codon:yes gene_type:complete
MAYMYCTSCGAKLQYSVSKPKFCSECGEGFDSVAVAKKAKIETDSDEDSGFIKPVRLDYEVSASEQSKMKIGDIIGTNEGAKVERRGAPNKKSDDPLGDALKECGPTRGPQNE